MLPRCQIMLPTTPPQPHARMRQLQPHQLIIELVLGDLGLGLTTPIPRHRFPRRRCG